MLQTLVLEECEYEQKRSASDEFQVLVAHYLHSTEISFMHLNAITASGHNETIFPVILS